MIGRRVLVIFWMMLGCWLSLAQDVQWAAEINEFSSERSPKQYSAQQVLEKPNVFPAGGENPNAWSPQKDDDRPFLKVGFASPTPIRQLIIAESENPGFITEIYAYDTNGNEYLLIDLDPVPIPLPSRLLNVFIDETPYQVAALKINMDQSKLDGRVAIDAIGISGSIIPVRVKINISEYVRKGIYIEKLGKNVNSLYSELGPILSPDGKTLFFSRKNHPSNMGGTTDPEDIYYAEFNEQTGEWSEAKNIGGNLNNELPNFVNSITADGNTLILGNRYMENGDYKPGVSISNKTDEGWSSPEPLTIENFYNYSKKAHYCLSNDREVLVLSIERDDSKGGRDIYVSFKQDSIWSTPLNLGTTINSVGDDSSPFLDQDNETLYFSSNGFSGFGGYDVFVSKRLDDTWQNWSEPENLGGEINTKSDDMFFTMPLQGEHAYFTKSYSNKNADIYRVELPIFEVPLPIITLNGKVQDQQNDFVGAKLSFESYPSRERLVETASDPVDGSYQVVLTGGENYKASVSADGFATYAFELTIDTVMKDSEIQKNIVLTSIKDSFDFSPIQFSFNDTKISDQAQSLLNEMASYLKSKGHIKIRVEGYTDNSGDEQYNTHLSEQRAKSVYNFLVSKGVPKTRIEVKAQGENRPVASNETYEGRSKNRRVEITIVN